eukprot:scaffold2.g6988.t1
MAPLVLPVPTNLNIIATAMATVFVGSFRSDAMKFPLVGSVVLFSLFLCFRFLPKEVVNNILAAYFVVLGMLALTATAEPLVAPWVPEGLSTHTLELKLRPVAWLPGLKEGIHWSCTPLELGLGCLSAAFCGWYVATKHWWANNALGLAFSIQGIEHLSLGLFFYDVFWVFGTPVMVSVAKNLDAPIKLLFPRWSEAAAGGKAPFSMLGLGDIVIPGIFVALVLRYDAVSGFRTRYFRSAFAGYGAGLAATIVVMNVFQAAQPALLYIVPGVLLATFAHAAARGEFQALLHWHEHEAEEAEEEAEGGGGWWEALFGGGGKAAAAGKRAEAEGAAKAGAAKKSKAEAVPPAEAAPSPARHTRAAAAAAAAAAVKKDM